MAARAYHTVEARVAPPASRMTPGVLTILILTCATHILVTATRRSDQAIALFGFVPDLWLRELRLWQPLTYALLHAPGLWHLGFNMLTLYFFGPGVEARTGTPRFVGIYAAAAFAGAMACWAVAAAARTTDVPLVGASGSLFALLALWALWWPNAVALLWGLVPVKMKWLVLGFVVFSVFSVAGPDRISHEGHLGGAVAGLAYWWWDRRGGGGRRDRRPRLRLIKGSKAQEERFREIVRDL